LNPRLVALGFNQLSHRALPIKTKKENRGVCTRKNCLKSAGGSKRKQGKGRNTLGQTGGEESDFVLSVTWLQNCVGSTVNQQIQE
jgi:hypothetical protein